MSDLAPATAVVLRSIAHILDAAAQREGWHRPARLVRIDGLPRGPEDDVRLAVRTLPPGVHPLAALHGYVVEPGVFGLGVVAEGRAYDGEGRRRGRARAVELAARDGTRVSGMRLRGSAFSLEEQGPEAPVVGEISRALYRALGVAIGPAPAEAGADRQPEGEGQT